MISLYARFPVPAGILCPTITFSFNHSVSEFVVDFINIMPGSPKAKVRSRIILTPQHAKRFVKALNDNIQRFEKAHGEIKDYEQPPIPLNFGPPGEA